MIGILKAIVTKLGGVDTSAKNHVDTFTEAKITGVPGEQLATSGQGGIWIEYQDLAGYTFLNVIVIGQYNLKTLTGCELRFYGNDFEKTLASDTQEIESDFSNVSNRWITQIAFDVTDMDVSFIENKIADTIELIGKKSKETFKAIK